METRSIPLSPEWIMAECDEIGPDDDVFPDLAPTVVHNRWGGYDAHRARLVDDDGHVVIYRFTRSVDHGVLEWEARFSSITPVEVVAAAWRAARS